MVAQKRARGGGGRNLAAEKARLMRMREHARELDDAEAHAECALPARKLRLGLDGVRPCMSPFTCVGLVRCCASDSEIQVSPEATLGWHAGDAPLPSLL